MRYASPLRYPGGKASLSNFLTDVIDLNDLRDCVYFEPYAGGAGAGLTLPTYSRAAVGLNMRESCRDTCRS